MQPHASPPGTNADHPPTLLPQELTRITTPLRWRTWEKALGSFPDREFAAYIVSGIREGFRIGFDYCRYQRLKSKARNLGSAYEHPNIVGDYLSDELREGRIAGSQRLLQLHFSSFGVIPKRSQPGKWRLILDLSSPEGRSVNNGIDQASCSLSYVSIDDVAAETLRYGRGALIAKSDIAHAYRQVPVHPEDRSLLGRQWKSRQYVDCTLPFGLRSASIMFSAVADAVEWIVRAQGVPEIFHYLDDFIIIGPPAGDACERHLHTFLQTCESLGVIVASR